jgi:nucleotide-binding universal stress UspA family protein
VDAAPEHGHFSPKRILHPVSFAQGYHESVEFARDVAELYGAQLILSHVLDPDLADKVNPRKTEQWAKNALDEAISDRTTLRVPLLTHVDCGNVIDEILHTAKVFRADWIVLGAKVFAETPIVANSIAYKLMAASKVPVLTLPHRIRRGAEKSTMEAVPVAAG